MGLNSCSKTLPEIVPGTSVRGLALAGAGWRQSAPYRVRMRVSGARWRPLALGIAASLG